MEGADRCCGSAGIYNMTHAAMSQHLLKEKMQSVGATTAEASGRAQSRLHAATCLRRKMLRPEPQVYHLMDLLDRAYSEAESHGREMKITHDQLAQRLQAALGTDAVNAEANCRASHVVDGVMPALVCAPQSAEQIAVDVENLCRSTSELSFPGAAARRWHSAIGRELPTSSSKSPRSTE